MSKKCIYCKEKIDENSVVDFCERCGKSVWGEKMYNAIIQNMEKARDNGDLCHSRTIEKPQISDEVIA
ncbi:hypothetical protein DRN73_06220 [Candidatus Pacearchaeota archaeon]|nr:MAG: hypothetical protein DRN73_06220 [Candidatus Pacearchaeota archaeon]